VEATVEYLLEHETMSGDDFKYFCENGGKTPPKTEKPEDPPRSSSYDNFPEIPDLSSYFDEK